MGEQDNFATKTTKKPPKKNPPSLNKAVTIKWQRPQDPHGVGVCVGEDRRNGVSVGEKTEEMGCLWV